MTDDEIRLAKILKLLDEWQPGEIGTARGPLFALWDAATEAGCADGGKLRGYGAALVRRAKAEGVL